MKPYTLLIIFLTLFVRINAQNFIIKEALFNQPNSSIVSSYFKNGMNVVLKNQNTTGQIIEISNQCDSVKLLDSFNYTKAMGFVFYEKNANIFYERIVENKTNTNVYLVRKNLTLNSSDSLFLRKTNHFGVYYSKIKRFGDTSVIQLWHFDSINPNQNMQVNDFYVVHNNAIVSTIIKPKYNPFDNALADFYLMNNKLFITCNYELSKLSMYVHDLTNTSIDSSIYYNYKPFSTATSNTFKFNYTKANQKLYLLNAYKTSSINDFDSLILIDIGSGTTLNKVNVYSANGDYSFIRNAIQQDYFVTGYYNKGAVINKLGLNLEMLPLINLNKTLGNKLLSHEDFIENMDTQYVSGKRYDNSVTYASIEKIYRAKTGIQNKHTETSSQISIYPNPAQQYFNINITNAPSQLISTNIVGQQFQLYKTELGYDISALPDGLYFIGFNIGNKSYNSKLWVKR